MSNYSNSIIHLQKDQIKPAAEMLAKAFIDNPMFALFIPNTAERAKKWPYLFQFQIRYGMRYGEVHTTSSRLEGAAIWFPSDKVKITIWRSIRCGVLPMIPKVGWKLLRRMETIDNYARSIHRRHAPFKHWFLAILGVEPHLQGSGYASALLKPMISRIDHDNLPCYVETENMKNVSMYQHFGFKIVEEFKIPGYDLKLWAMLRDKAT